MPQEFPLDTQWLIFALMTNNALTVEEAQQIMESLPEPEFDAFGRAALDKITARYDDSDRKVLAEQFQVLVNYAREQAATGEPPPFEEGGTPQNMTASDGECGRDDDGEDGDRGYEFTCPHCGRKNIVESAFVGLHVRCACGQSFPTAANPDRQDRPSGSSDVVVDGIVASRRLYVIKAVRGWTNMGMKEAIAFVNELPSALTNIPTEKAEELKKHLEEAGAVVHLESSEPSRKTPAQTTAQFVSTADDIYVSVSDREYKPPCTSKPSSISAQLPPAPADKAPSHTSEPSSANHKSSSSSKCGRGTRRHTHGSFFGWATLVAVIFMVGIFIFSKMSDPGNTSGDQSASSAASAPETSPRERENTGDNGDKLQADRRDNTKTEVKNNEAPLYLFEAEKKYRAAAEKGDIGAQFKLGLCYAKGDGVLQDDQKMAYWWRKAADQGYVKAQVNMALCYANGKGVPQDDAEAVKWYHKAAIRGNPVAQYELGVCYTCGRGVVKDCGKASHWMQKAAVQGYAAAQYDLASDYIHTSTQSIVPHNTARGVYWMRKAAEQGYARAQLSLGLLYATGDGVPKDNGMARYWFKKADAQALIDEQKKLNRVQLKGERTFLE